VRQTPDNRTQEFNAGHIDVFLAERTLIALLADVATVCA
jgi:hypothetical protein